MRSIRFAPICGREKNSFWHPSLRYLEETGILPEEIIAFGDAENDLEMVRFAGIGVAMGNGVEAVKAAANFVTADIDDDGIEKALRHYRLI